MDLYQELFNYFSKEHGVSLLQQDMKEVIHIIEKHNTAQKISSLKDWYVEEIWKENGSFYRVTTKTESVCNIITRNSEKAKQNAYLIAKAPKMLQILMFIVDNVDISQIAQEKIEKLIKE